MSQNYKVLVEALDGWHDALGLLEARVCRDKVGEDQGDKAREGSADVESGVALLDYGAIGDLKEVFFFSSSAFEEIEISFFYFEDLEISFFSSFAEKEISS